MKKELDKVQIEAILNEMFRNPQMMSYLSESIKNIVYQKMEDGSAESKIIARFQATADALDRKIKTLSNKLRKKPGPKKKRNAGLSGQD